MRNFVRTALLAAALATGTALAPAQEVKTATHGAWDIICADDGKICVMQQTAKGAEGNTLMEVRIRKLDGVTADNGTPVPAAIQIAAPIGVLLRAGVRVQVDGGQVRTGIFEICVPGGCIVRDVLPEDFVNEMKRGSNARMTIVSPQQGDVVATLSLSGFTKAYNSIKP